MGLISGVRSYFKDLLNLRLLIVKVIYFTLLSGVVIIWPQLTIHQQRLGLTTYQTGICSSVTSAIAILAPLFAGFTGDKLGNYKVFMSVSTALTGVGAFFFTIVPRAKTSINIDFTNGTTSGDGGFNDDFSGSTNTLGDFSRLTTSMEDDAEKLSVTFWSYLAVRVVFGVFQIVGYILFEAAVLAQVKENGVDFGFQRVWGTLAVLVCSLLGGFLVQATTFFNVIFYVSAVLHLLSAGLMLGLTMDYKPKSESHFREVFRHLINPEAIMLFSAMLAAGVIIGYLETFLYPFVISLGANTLLIRLMISVGIPFEVFFTLITSYFVSLIGHAPLIVIGLFAYVIRLVGVSFLGDPWLVLPLEVLKSVANGLLFTAAKMYCSVLFSTETMATFRAFYAVVYFGVGTLLGTTIGSQIRASVGDRVTFRIMAGVALVCCLIYCLALFLLKRHRAKSHTLKESMPPTPRSQTSRRGVDNCAYEKDDD